MEHFKKSENFYEIDQCLGEGLSGCVYRAFKNDPESGLRSGVALKILKSKKLIELWKAEFATLSQVRSQYCISLLGWDRIDGFPTLVLELVDGVSLEELRHSLDRSSKYEVLRQIQLGLEDLRQAGLCHGDLSPQNVLVTEQGEVRLIDFGLANQKFKQATPQFAAPEVLNGEKASSMGDIYSLGRLAKYLFVGEKLPHFWKKSWFHPKKEKRQWVKIEESPLVRSLIGQKVKKIRRMKAESRQTVPLITPLRKKPKTVAFISMLLAVSLGGSLQAHTGAHIHRAKEAYLTVAGEKWMAVKLNQQPQGYAPLDLKLMPGVKYHLSIQTSQGHYQRTLTLKPGDLIFISDKDL